MTLSAVIITLNEERNIRRCLASLQGLADEIVVVDSLSTDGTKAICEEYGVRFYEQPFLGFIEQKNFALEKAGQPYVLCLDADEALSDELLASIQLEKAAGFPSTAYSMNRFSYYCGTWLRHGSFYPDNKIRLFKNGIGVWGGENPHDKIELKEGIKPKHLRGDILHYIYQSFAEHRKQTDKFSTIAAEALYKKGAKSSWVKRWVSPGWRFIKEYFLKLGFLDGKAGFMAAYLSARLAWYKYKKFARLKKGDPPLHETL